MNSVMAGLTEGIRAASGALTLGNQFNQMRDSSKTRSADAAAAKAMKGATGTNEMELIVNKLRLGAKAYNEAGLPDKASELELKAMDIENGGQDRATQAERDLMLKQDIVNKTDAVAESASYEIAMAGDTPGALKAIQRANWGKEVTGINVDKTTGTVTYIMPGAEFKMSEAYAKARAGEIGSTTRRGSSGQTAGLREAGKLAIEQAGQAKVGVEKAKAMAKVDAILSELRGVGLDEEEALLGRLREQRTALQEDVDEKKGMGRGDPTRSRNELKRVDAAIEQLESGLDGGAGAPPLGVATKRPDAATKKVLDKAAVFRFAAMAKKDLGLNGVTPEEKAKLSAYATELARKEGYEL